jgi:hypothetical protein
VAIALAMLASSSACDDRGDYGDLDFGSEVAPSDDAGGGDGEESDVPPDVGPEGDLDFADAPPTDGPPDVVPDPGDTPAEITDTGPDVGPDASEDEAICARWRWDREDLSEGTWTGSVDTCTSGDVTGGGRENALKLVNLYRWLVDLPPVVADPARNQQAQDCALMMHANGTLNHRPPTSWRCYTESGASGAGNSNIASGPGVSAVDMYISDWGNATTIGHRRWILSDGLGTVGIGSTSSYSCLHILHYFGGSRAWTAFPGPGPFPIQAMNASYQSIDETGWTLQSDSIPLGAAVVTITSGGSTLPVATTQLLGNYGSNYAISIIPQGWRSEAGRAYHVEVTGTSTPISYDVRMIDCR